MAALANYFLNLIICGDIRVAHIALITEGSKSSLAGFAQ